MNFPDINIHLIAETKIDRAEIRKWLNGIGVSDEGIDEILPAGNTDISDGELLVGMAAKRCYKSYEPGLNPNVQKVRKAWKDYFLNVLRSRHGSVIEHMNWTFAFENVTRVFTAEMNRHRAGVAVSEQSLRYVRFEDIPFWIPPSVKPDTAGHGAMLHDLLEAQGGNPDNLPSQFPRDSLDYKKAKTVYTIKQLLSHTEEAYRSLVETWDFDSMPDFHRKKVITSMLRRIVPLGVCTGAVYTMNGRAIRHIISMRASAEAEEEICHVFTRVGKIMVEKAPYALQDFKQTPEGFWYPEFSKV